MKWKDYELSCYHGEDLDEIVNLARFLWKSSDERNRQYIIWKHQKNPLLKKAVSIVARYKGKVVGFLGNVPASWKIGERKFMVLQSSDIVIHPEHQGRWLGFAMARATMQIHSGEYRLFLGFTPNHNVALGPMRLGWRQLGSRNYLRHINWLRLTRNKVLGKDGNMLKLGNFGEVEVSNTLRPFDISRIDAGRFYPLNKLHQDKSPEFLEWRLSNPKAEFVYLYHLSESKTDAYVILSLDKVHAHIFDYGDESGSMGVKRLLSFILERARFASISFLDAGTPEDIKTYLRDKRFYAFDQINKLRNRKSYHLPLLVRPTKLNCVEDDWFVNGFDVRDIDNWQITEMCFD